MAVEIHVLSGALQGQCMRFDGDRILVGDDATADLRFDPDREAGARGKNAVLTLDDEEGWRISNEGGGVWLVNQTAVPAGASNRLRSDDLVRVSELGPEFYFRLVARARGAAIPAPASPNHHEPQKSDGPPQPEFAGAPALNRSPRGDTDPDLRSAGEEDKDPFDAVLDQLRRRPLRAAVAVAVMRKDGNIDQRLQDSREGGVPSDTEPSDPVVAAAAELPAEAAAPKRKRRVREVSTFGRLIGIAVAGLLGLACAYCLGCWFGGEKNDAFHVFFEKPPSSGAKP